MKIIREYAYLIFIVLMFVSIWRHGYVVTYLNFGLLLITTVIVVLLKHLDSNGERG